MIVWISGEIRVWRGILGCVSVECQSVICGALPLDDMLCTPNLYIRTWALSHSDDWYGIPCRFA
jgi:hypothetical protein